MLPDNQFIYLVGGSFKDEENAKTYMEELKEKDFDPFYIGKQGNFYMVGIGKYKTEGQAVRTRDTIWMKDPGLGSVGYEGIKILGKHQKSIHHDKILQISFYPGNVVWIIV